MQKYYIFKKSNVFRPENLIIMEAKENYNLSAYDVGFFATKEEAEEVRERMIQEQLDQYFRNGGETAYFSRFCSNDFFKTGYQDYPAPEFLAKYGYEAFDPDPEYSGSKYWHIKKL
jgi:hypothetical protein